MKQILFFVPCSFMFYNKKINSVSIKLCLIDQFLVYVYSLKIVLIPAPIILATIYYNLNLSTITMRLLGKGPKKPIFAIEN